MQPLWRVLKHMLNYAPELDRVLQALAGQGTYLDGIDGPQAPALRQGGTEELLDNLARYRERPGD
jgi:hypothetical protein